MSHNKFQVEEFVKDVVFQVSEEDSIKKSSRLIKDLGITEEGLLYIADQIENEFEIDVYEDEIEEWDTVRDIIKFVLNSIKEQEW